MIAASFIVCLGLIGAARADSADVKCVARCLKDNRDAKLDSSVIQKYRARMSFKMSGSETRFMRRNPIHEDARNLMDCSRYGVGVEVGNTSRFVVSVWMFANLGFPHGKIGLEPVVGSAQPLEG
jgi:hypothetical protein